MLYIDGNSFSPDYLINAPFVFFPVFILLLILRIRTAFQAHRVSVTRELIIFSFLYYLYRLSGYTIFPVFWFTDRSRLPAFGRALLIEAHPLHLFLNLNYYSLYNIIGNLLLLFPMGFYLCLFMQSRHNQNALCTPSHPKVSLRQSLYSVRKAAAAIFFISLFIECLQLTMTFFYFGDRIFDINDLLLNTLGGAAGCLLYVSPAGKWIRKLYG